MLEIESLTPQVPRSANNLQASRRVPSQALKQCRTEPKFESAHSCSGCRAYDFEYLRGPPLEGSGRVVKLQRLGGAMFQLQALSAGASAKDREREIG